MTSAVMDFRTSKLERSFPVTPARAFAAWSELEQRAQWNSPSEEVEIRYTEDDFSIGGKDVSLCLAGDHILAEVIGVYHDIVPDTRIIYTEIIKSGEGEPFGTSQVSVGFVAEGDETRMTITLQTVAVDGSGLLDDVVEGWTEALVRMEKLLG